MDIGAPTCGTIPDAVIQTTDANGTPGIQVTVKAQSSGVAYPPNLYIAFAKRYKVAWDYVPAEASRARTYQVHFDHVRVWRSGGDGDAEWAWGLRANEKWIFPVAGSAEDGLHFYEESSIDDNDNDCEGSDGDCNDYSINETLTVSVRPGEPINIWSRVIEADDPGPAVFDPNDVLPTYDHDHFGPGTFSSGLLENSEGAYEIFYTITDVTKAAPTLGTLTIGAPQYGPNGDTGGCRSGVTRCSRRTASSSVRRSAGAKPAVRSPASLGPAARPTFGRRGRAECNELHFASSRELLPQKDRASSERRGSSLPCAQN